MKIVGLSGWTIPISAPRKTLSRAMPHIRAAHPEDDILGDVGGVIGNPLQVARDGESVEGLHGRLRFRAHALCECRKSLPVYTINLIVAFEHMLCQIGIRLDE